MNRVLGIALLVLGLYGLIGMPHDVGYFWAGIAGVALGSMLTAFSFSGPGAEPDLRIEPRFGPRTFAAQEPQLPDAKPAQPPVTPIVRPAPVRPISQIPAPRVQVQAPPPKSPSANPAPRAAAPIPMRPTPGQPRRLPTYGWFGAGRNIQMAGSLNELMTAIRSGALKSQTSVHRIDAAGNTGPVIAANSDPVLRGLFWAAENAVPDNVLPGLVKSLMQDEQQADDAARNSAVG